MRNLPNINWLAGFLPSTVSGFFDAVLLPLLSRAWVQMLQQLLMSEDNLVDPVGIFWGHVIQIVGNLQYHLGTPFGQPPY